MDRSNRPQPPQHNPALRAAELSKLAAERFQAGDLAQALALFRQSTDLCPEVAAYHNNVGVVCSRLGQCSDAVAAYRRAVALDPKNPSYVYNLGSVFFRTGNLSDAEKCYEEAVELVPRYGEAYYNLGLTQQAMGKRESALFSFQKAAELLPNDPDTLNNLGIALAYYHDTESAVNCFLKAIHAKPDYSDAYGNLAIIQAKQRKFEEAIASYRAALQFAPGRLNFLSGLTRQLQMVCDWNDVEYFSRQIVQGVECTSNARGVATVEPFDFLALPITTTPEQQRKCSEAWSKKLLETAPKLNYGARKKRDDSRITVGYLSSDFRAHVIAHLVVGLFEQHDRQRFRLIGYSYGPDDGSIIRCRIANAFEQFVDLQRESDMAAATRIWNDGVDIVVDLTGYTSHSRTNILATRPAPVQVSYLGYAGSMGAPFIDYAIVDHCVVPTEEQCNFSEKLVYLPDCYYVNDRTESLLGGDFLEISREECGLSDSDFVFSCFNNNYKITPLIFEAWMKILSEVPDSVLWLLESSKASSSNLRYQAKQYGINPERIVFAPRRPLQEHVQRNRLADLALDTVPYNGHTTTADALRFGCPVLTIEGRAFCSRVASSMLRSMQLNELITSNENEYIWMALQLARNPAKLNAIRNKLGEQLNTSSLFDPAQFARKLECAYEIMWKRHTDGVPPETFHVPNRAD